RLCRAWRFWVSLGRSISVKGELVQRGTLRAARRTSGGASASRTRSDMDRSHTHRVVGEEVPDLRLRDARRRIIQLDARDDEPVVVAFMDAIARPKQLLVAGGASLVRRAVDAACASLCGEQSREGSKPSSSPCAISRI